MPKLAIAALAPLAFAAGVAAAPPPSARVETALLELEREAARAPEAAVAWGRSRGMRVTSEVERSRVLAVVEIDGDVAGSVSSIEAAGAQVEATTATDALAWVPLDALETVAAVPGVRRIRRPIRSTWEAVSEGVSLTNADLMHDRGYTGQGIRVGVIDIFQGFETRLGNELPTGSRVTFRSFINGGGSGSAPHGVDVAEIITDMAPDVHLYLAAIEDDFGYRLAIDWLIANRVHIINHSGGFGLFGDMKGNGPVHPKVSQAAGAGILYVGAAGNSAREHWEGAFTDRDGDDLHEWMPGVESLPINMGDPAFLELRVDLTWDDWRPSPVNPRPNTDYDICVYDEGGREVACARDRQSGLAGQVPYEALVVQVPRVGLYQLQLERIDGEDDLFLEIMILPNVDIGPFAIPSSSIISPSDHREILTVGASGLNDVVRSYSSRGPTNDGRLKPNLLGPDGVSLSSGTFFGTSAATPHVSGAAALLWEWQPGLSRNEVRSRILGRAVELPSDPMPGVDDVHGHGRLDANFIGAQRGGAPNENPPQSSGGGGCRLARDEETATRLELPLIALVLLGWAWHLQRRS